MKLRISHAVAVTGVVAAVLSVVGAALAVAPADGGAAPRAQAAQCKARDLYVAKGRVEGAAGNRYLKVKLVNVGHRPCTMGLATRAGFSDWSGVLTTGVLSSGGGTITLNEGGKARTTIHWSDPGPVPAEDCDAATATLVTLRVPSIGRTWRIPQRAAVCTTPEYAPDSQPLH